MASGNRRASLKEFLRLERSGFQALNGLALAYACCLPAEDLVAFIGDNIFENSNARRLAIRALASKGQDRERAIAKFAGRILAAQPTTYRQVQSRNIVLDQLYDGFSSEQKALIVKSWQNERWSDSKLRLSMLSRRLQRYVGGAALIDYWLHSANQSVLATILSLSPARLLGRRAAELLSSPLPPWALSKLLLRLADGNPEIIECARERDPIGYLYLCVKLQKPLVEQDVQSLLRHALYDDRDRRGLAIWALGRLGHHRILIDLAKQDSTIFDRDLQTLLSVPREVGLTHER